VTCYFFPGWGWYFTEAEAELKIVFNWTTIFQRSGYESSITSLEMIDDPSPDFEAGSSTPNHKLFKQKVVNREEFSSRSFVEDKIFLLSTMKKKLLITKIFFINKCDFLQKIEKSSFYEKWQFLGGGRFSLKIWSKMGGSPLPFGMQQYYGKSGTSAGTPPPKLQNCHGNKLEKRTWLGTTMRGFQWQTSYTNY